MIRDPFVAAAFKAAEDLDGGAAEVAPDTGRQVREVVEA
jgi:hypothetical protein